MIVLENVTNINNKIMEHYKKSVETYWALHELCKLTNEHEIKRAIKEMMYDEYLHARYMRKYLMSHDAYMNAEDVERKFLLIESDD